MIEIRPIEDKHVQEALAARCHVPYTPNSFAYAAFRGETPSAICQFSFRVPTDAVKCGSARLLSLGCISPESEDLSEPLLIGVLSFCIQNGCTAFECADGVPTSALQALDFLPNVDAVHRNW